MTAVGQATPDPVLPREPLVRAEEILKGEAVPSGIVDTHSHLVPGVDDGARDLDQAVQAVGTLANEGVRHVLTTPHIDASVIARPEVFDKAQREVEEAWYRVVDACMDREPRMTYHLGREIMLDSMAPDVSDPRVRLNGGPYVLVEFPRLNLPMGSEEVLYHIVAEGYLPIVAHVERYLYHEDAFSLMADWRHAGAALQLNAASLVGRYGGEAKKAAWGVVEQGLADLVASDFHARGQPWISQARVALIEHGGEEQERVMFGVNPKRLLRGEALVPVNPLTRQRGLFKRWRRRFGFGS